MLNQINPAHIEPLCSAAERFLSKENPSRTRENKIRGWIDNLRERQDEIAYLKLIDLLDMYKSQRLDLSLEISGNKLSGLSLIKATRNLTDQLNSVELSVDSSKDKTIKPLYAALRTFTRINHLHFSNVFADLRVLDGLPIQSLRVWGEVVVGLPDFIANNPQVKELEIDNEVYARVEDSLINALVQNKTLKVHI